MQTLITTGGNLFALACVYLGDATQWNRIASLNNISDPWLNGMFTLVLPAVDPSAGGGVGPQ
jgi:hypothetical protein